MKIEERELLLFLFCRTDFEIDFEKLVHIILKHSTKQMKGLENKSASF